MIERPPGDATPARTKSTCPPTRAEIATAGNLGVGLSGQVDLDCRVDGVELGQRRSDRDVVRVVGAAHVDRSTAFREVAQTLRSEQPAGDRTPGVAPLVRVGDNPRSTRSTSTSETTPLCTPSSRWLESARATAAGSVPIPSCTVARSGMSAATCSATERSTGRRLGIRHVDEPVVAFDQDIDVVAVDERVAARGRQRRIDERDHHTRLLNQRLREIRDDAEREATARQRLDLDERDVDAQLAAAQQRRDRAHVARNDVGQRGDAAIRSRAVERAERKVLGELGTQRVRRRQAEEERRPGEIRTLRDERLRQRERLARPLRPADHVMRTHVVRKTQSVE